MMYADHPRAVARWRQAQRLELDFWRRWTTLPPYQDLDIPQYWRAEVAHFGTTWERFRGLRVLDVGCGPFGLIHYIDQAAERIRVDPLLPDYVEKLALPGPQLSISAMGESLPLAARSIDLAICFNALDHMLHPEAALDEIARVLKANGTALFMIHTFPAWLRPLFAMDHLHPHHYSAKAFEAAVQARFRIEGCKTERRRFHVPPSKWLNPACWKYMAAGLVVTATYITASQG
jgi:ubiquinone/menaquinone biosynthesis C-methylase UbiE